MNFDRNITAAVPSRIEEITAGLVHLKNDCDSLEEASARLREQPDAGFGENIYLQRAMQERWLEIDVLEEALSICEPQNAREVLIMTAVSYHRMDLINPEVGDIFQADCRVIRRTLGRIIPALEKLAGVTLSEIGLDSYFTPMRSVPDLTAAAEKVEAKHKAA
jgi:hypothetical protein